MSKLYDERITVVIPVKNEAKHIGVCLEGILSQTVPVIEIIVIDSGSSDGTQEIASSYSKVKLIDIAPEQFNHGDTRNLGVKLAKGEYVLFTVGDARPVDENWIKNMRDGFINESVVGVCGQQVVAHEKNTNPVEWFKPVSRNYKMISYQYDTPNEFEKAPAEEKRAACGWDDVSAMYRRDILQRIPFKKIVYGEDVYWSIDALKSGFTLTYNPAAQVYHFHKEDYRTTLKRTIAVCYLRYIALGVVPEKTRSKKIFLVSVYRIFKERRLSLRESLFWVKYNFDLNRGISSGLKYFEQARMKSGDEGLDILHRKYCGTPPIPVKHEGYIPTIS